MKVFRILGLTLLGIIALVIAAVVIAALVIDPNTYKPQIERTVENATNLELTLAGDIDWSLIPLGLSISDVNADLEGEPFARLDNLIAEVDFWSLLRVEPEVNTFVLEGMSAFLNRNAQGEGNWERIMKEDPAAGETAPTQQEPAAPDATGDDSQPLQFEVQQVRIADAQVRFRDEASDQEVVLDQVNLDAENITLGSGFPLTLSFHFATSAPVLDIAGELDGEVLAAEDLQRFTLKNLESHFEISGEPVNNQTIESSLSGNFDVDLANETATIDNFRAELINLVLQTSAEVNGFGDNLQVSGDLRVEPFSARQLLDELGQDPIATRDPDVLQNIALQAQLGGGPGQIQLNDFQLTLDDTRLAGEIEYGLANGAIGVDLQGNTLNLDRYLPPETEEDADTGPAGTPPEEETAGTGSTGGAGSTPAAPETDLLPLETLRELLFNVRLGLDELIASGLTIENVEFQATGEDGLINVDPIRGDLYEGDFNLTAQLDARQDTPRWQVNPRLNSVQILPLLQDLAELDMISGGANLRADIETRGNRISALRENASGSASFAIEEGAFEKTNLTAYACEGIALANGETINTNTWPRRTPFNDMSGTVQIDGNTLTNESLSAALAGLELNGEGDIDLAGMLLDYELGLRIVGAVHEDNACRVSERVQNIVIPLECRGSLEQTDGLCSFDGSRFRDNLKDMARDEARRKASKEVDRALDKQLDKVLGDDEEDDNETRRQIKDAVKGLFGR